jgi:hypothetical protein
MLLKRGINLGTRRSGSYSVTVLVALRRRNLPVLALATDSWCERCLTAAT